MVAAVPTLTDFNGFGPVLFPNGTPTANFQSVDGGLRGGSVTGANAKAAALCNAAAFNAIPSLSWAVGVRGSLALSTGGKFNILGFVGDSSLYGVATYDAVDATKYILYTFKSAGAVEKTAISTVACDGGVHNFVLGFDFASSTLKLYIDGTQRASLADLSALVASDVYVGLKNTTQGD